MPSAPSRILAHRFPRNTNKPRTVLQAQTKPKTGRTSSSDVTLDCWKIKNQTSATRARPSNAAPIPVYRKPVSLSRALLAGLPSAWGRSGGGTAPGEGGAPGPRDFRPSHAAIRAIPVPAAKGHQHASHHSERTGDAP